MRVLPFIAAMFLILSSPAIAELTSDREMYIPGETVMITLTYPEELGKVSINITDAYGRRILTKAAMEKEGGVWFYNYSIRSSYPSGEYKIRVSASRVGALVEASDPVLEFEDRFSVMAWNFSAYLENYHMTTGDNVNLTVMLEDKYSDKITYYVKYQIIGPSGKAVYNYSFSLPGDSVGFRDSYDIPDNFTLGNSNLYLVIKDSDGRNATANLSFSVTKPLSIEPEIVEEQLSEDVVYRVITIKNLMEDEISIDSAEISDDLKDFVLINQRPYLLENSGEAEIKIDARGLEPGTYTGSIAFLVNGVRTSIPIRIVVPTTEQSLSDNSFIIWSFAAGIIFVIIIITAVRYSQLKKKRLEELRRQKKAAPKPDIFSRTKDEYRTEYY